MDNTTQLDQIIRKLDRLYLRMENRMDRFDKKLNNLFAEQKKEQWVRVSFIQQVTGWSGEKMAQARKQELVRWQDRADGRWYDLNSIPQVFLNRYSHDNRSAPSEDGEETRFFNRTTK